MADSFSGFKPTEEVHRVAQHRPASIDNGEVKMAIRQGLAEGFRIHLPGTVGLFTKGIIVCALMAFAHFVVEIEWPPSLLLSGAAVGGPSLLRILRNRDGSEDD